MADGTTEKQKISLGEKNKRLEQVVKELRHRCDMQAKILNTGNLSVLQNLLDQLTIYINVQLKNILTELQFTEYDPSDTVALYKFREFLLAAHAQLGIFLALPDGLVHIEMRRLLDKHTQIGNTLCKLNGMPHDVFTDILEAQDRLHEFILQAIEVQGS